MDPVLIDTALIDTALIDTDRHPIDPADAGRDAFIADCRRRYLDDGVVALAGFVTAEALAAIAVEANALVDDAFFAAQRHTAYLTHGDDSHSTDDPRSRLLDTSVGSIGYDQLPVDSTLRRLYGDDRLTRFIGEVVGYETPHRFADPMGACSVNVYRDGDAHNWHFDEAESSVTLLVQQPDEGGAFEYVPNLRGRADELEKVRSTIEGDTEGVITLPFEPGTLLIFAGRQTLHRVTECRGSTPRLVPVLCYADSPGTVNSDDVRMMFWGRTEAQSPA